MWTSFQSKQGLLLTKISLQKKEMLQQTNHHQRTQSFHTLIILELVRLIWATLYVLVYYKLLPTL